VVCTVSRRSRVSEVFVNVLITCTGTLTGMLGQF